MPDPIPFLILVGLVLVTAWLLRWFKNGNVAPKVREPEGKFWSQTARQPNCRFVFAASQWPSFLSTTPMQK